VECTTVALYAYFLKLYTRFDYIRLNINWANHSSACRFRTKGIGTSKTHP